LFVHRAFQLNKCNNTEQHISIVYTWHWHAWLKSCRN